MAWETKKAMKQKPKPAKASDPKPRPANAAETATGINVKLLFNIGLIAQLVRAYG